LLVTFDFKFKTAFPWLASAKPLDFFVWLRPRTFWFLFSNSRPSSVVTRFEEHNKKREGLLAAFRRRNFCVSSPPFQLPSSLILGRSNYLRSQLRCCVLAGSCFLGQPAIHLDTSVSVLFYFERLAQTLKVAS
jgi:hypothetical protein